MQLNKLFGLRQSILRYYIRCRVFFQAHTFSSLSLLSSDRGIIECHHIKQIEVTFFSHALSTFLMLTAEQSTPTTYDSECGSLFHAPFIHRYNGIHYSIYSSFIFILLTPWIIFTTLFSDAIYCDWTLMMMMMM